MALKRLVQGITTNGRFKATEQCIGLKSKRQTGRQVFLRSSVLTVEVGIEDGAKKGSCSCCPPFALVESKRRGGNGKPQFHANMLFLVKIKLVLSTSGQKQRRCKHLKSGLLSKGYFLDFFDVTALSSRQGVPHLQRQADPRLPSTVQ